MTPAHKPRFLLYWPSWVTMFLVGYFVGSFCVYVTTDQDDFVVDTQDVAWISHSYGWPLPYVRCRQDVTLDLPTPPWRWFPVGLAVNVGFWVWATAGNVFVVERISRNCRTPPRFTVAMLLSLFLVFGLWIKLIPMFASMWNPFRLALNYQSQIYLFILPSYATVLWIGKLWDWVVRRRRQAGTE